MSAKSFSHVVCVDDDPDILELATMALELVGGLSVTALSSGQEAVERVRLLMPDLILLDVMMPNMDGLKVLKTLRTAPELAHTPIVFMTARVNEFERRMYLEQGIHGVIDKPFDPMTLTDKLKSIWQNVQTERAHHDHT